MPVTSDPIVGDNGVNEIESVVGVVMGEIY